MTFLSCSFFPFSTRAVTCSLGSVRVHLVTGGQEVGAAGRTVPLLLGSDVLVCLLLPHTELCSLFSPRRNVEYPLSQHS